MNDDEERKGELSVERVNGCQLLVPVECRYPILAHKLSGAMHVKFPVCSKSLGLILEYQKNSCTLLYSQA